MMRSTKPGVLTGLAMLVLFVAALVAVHLFVSVFLERAIADGILVVLFFVGVFFWGGRS